MDEEPEKINSIKLDIDNPGQGLLNIANNLEEVTSQLQEKYGISPSNNLPAPQRSNNPEEITQHLKQMAEKIKLVKEKLQENVAEKPQQEPKPELIGAGSK